MIRNMRSGFTDPPPHEEMSAAIGRRIILLFNSGSKFDIIISPSEEDLGVLVQKFQGFKNDSKERVISDVAIAAFRRGPTFIISDVLAEMKRRRVGTGRYGNVKYFLGDVNAKLKGTRLRLMQVGVAKDWESAEIALHLIPSRFKIK